MARNAVCYLQRKNMQFIIMSNAWPLNSLDLNPFDYVWDALQQTNEVLPQSTK